MNTPAILLSLLCAFSQPQAELTPVPDPYIETNIDPPMGTYLYCWNKLDQLIALNDFMLLLIQQQNDLLQKWLDEGGLSEDDQQALDDIQTLLNSLFDARQQLMNDIIQAGCLAVAIPPI